MAERKMSNFIFYIFCYRFVFSGSNKNKLIMKSWIKNAVNYVLGFVGGILACYLVLTPEHENILMPMFIIIVFTTVGFNVLVNER